MQSCFDRLLTWSDKNDMVVNFNKTKEMVMGPPSLTSNLPLIHTTTGILNELIRLNYWVSIWTLILPGTHTHRQVYLRLIWSIIIKLLSDLYSNMRALFSIQALQVSSRRNLTQFNDGSVKLFSMTGLTMTPVPFLGYLVSTKDDKNSAKNSFNLLVVLITVCITYCRACVILLSPIV